MWCPVLRAPVPIIFSQVSSFCDTKKELQNLPERIFLHGDRRSMPLISAQTSDFGPPTELEPVELQKHLRSYSFIHWHLIPVKQFSGKHLAKPPTQGSPGSRLYDFKAHGPVFLSPVDLGLASFCTVMILSWAGGGRILPQKASELWQALSRCKGGCNVGDITWTFFTTVGV